MSRQCDFCGRPAKEPGFFRCESCLERIGAFVEQGRREAFKEAAEVATKELERVKPFALKGETVHIGGALAAALIQDAILALAGKKESKSKCNGRVIHDEITLCPVCDGQPE
jgi:hypothetical protein